MLIEWPHGSGVVADYSDEERRMVRGLFRACSDGEISDEQRDREVGLIHDLKALLDGRLVGEEESSSAPEQTVLYLPPPDSAFQIPQRALERLGVA